MEDEIMKVEVQNLKIWTRKDDGKIFQDLNIHSVDSSIEIR